MQGKSLSALSRNDFTGKSMEQNLAECQQPTWFVNPSDAMRDQLFEGLDKMKCNLKGKCGQVAANSDLGMVPKLPADKSGQMCHFCDHAENDPLLLDIHMSVHHPLLHYRKIRKLQAKSRPKINMVIVGAPDPANNDRPILSDGSANFSDDGNSSPCGGEFSDVYMNVEKYPDGDCKAYRTAEKATRRPAAMLLSRHSNFENLLKLCGELKKAMLMSMNKFQFSKDQ